MSFSTALQVRRQTEPDATGGGFEPWRVSARHRTVSELETQKFCDFVGEVHYVKIERTPPARVILNMTDYTNHKFATQQGSQRIPMIAVTLWDEHVDVAEKMNIRHGDHLFLKNMSCKVGKQSIIELNMNGYRGKGFPQHDPIHILERDSPFVTEIQARREAKGIDEQVREQTPQPRTNPFYPSSGASSSRTRSDASGSVASSSAPSTSTADQAAPETDPGDETPSTRPILKREPSGAQQPLEQPEPAEPEPEEPEPEEPELHRLKGRQSKAQQPEPQRPRERQSKAQQPEAQQPKAQQPKAQQPKAQQSKAQQSKAQQSKAQQPKGRQPEAQQSKSDRANNKANLRPRELRQHASAQNGSGSSAQSDSSSSAQNDSGSSTSTGPVTRVDKDKVAAAIRTDKAIGMRFRYIKISAHVVGFEPPNIRDFSVPYCHCGREGEKNVIPRCGGTCTRSHGPLYKYDFKLKLRDEVHQTYHVHVDNQQAKTLLGASVGDAGNYEKNPDRLGKLKQQLARIGVIERSPEQTTDQLTQGMSQLSSQDSEKSTKSTNIVFECYLKIMGPKDLLPAGGLDHDDDDGGGEKDEYQSQILPSTQPEPSAQPEPSRTSKRRNPDTADDRKGKKPCRNAPEKDMDEQIGYELVYTEIC